MRIRRKPWARPELEASSVFIKEPAQHRGKWADVFETKQPIHLEVGCGRGSFIAQKGAANPDINYLAFDIKSDMLGYANRNVQRFYSEKNRNCTNIRLAAVNIERIGLIMSEEDQVDRIYINFCNPWPRPKHKKKRLTHSRQLENYKKFLKPGGEIYFKTDDDGLFADSLVYFKESGFDITFITFDMTKDPIPDNILTEHEKMFMEEGIKIKGLTAVYREENK